tara:strand:- start:16338 stop:16490 length:153 start_codon:yes stop_codon:yes gene_type:complete
MKSGTSNLSKEDIYLEYLTKVKEKTKNIQLLIKQIGYELDTLIKTLERYR